MLKRAARMLPEPTFTFTIPSVHDNTTLDCRIYNPTHGVLDATDGDEHWHPRGAIFAHPYAPLGGCFDDGVVLSATAEVLKQGFIVGTFNFRYSLSPTMLVLQLWHGIRLTSR